MQIQTRSALSERCEAARKTTPHEKQEVAALVCSLILLPQRAAPWQRLSMLQGWEVLMLPRFGISPAGPLGQGSLMSRAH